ncbi:GAF and ANTAR domain-containing protein [Mycolicibacterium arenosum]|uniref:GAF and ANTAR domain-containing protein n=1 Tax=Mycolicibacterium arenosum TaxID=2952157 RepID=A0ABT1MF23_9MYCO|nr:GAF and ANTAR domain-containing protein [Mycolicibacterium sp. CAU 1645]MCP9276809.1 GAF and ANTAR domain-containing protein [Mycolicibacterium sp. CAU 1645]
MTSDRRDSLAGLEGLGALGESEFNALHVLCRALHVEEADFQGTLTAILASVTSTVRGVDHAGVNLLTRRGLEPQATIGGAPPPLDELQWRTGVGPCIDASRNQRRIDVEDLTDDPRWPEFAAAAVELGVLAMLCVPLWVDDRRLGSLSLYAGSRGAFDDTARRIADLYATHAAVVLLEAQRTEQLRRALANRDLIGQAKGVLMTRYRITADDAFERLRATSQRTNRKVVVVAEFVAATGDLPP